VSRAANPATPRLSVAIGSTEPWDHIEPYVRTIARQAVALGGEVVLAVGHPEAPPDPLPPELAGVTIVREPGASVFGLRTLATDAARGDILVITEDHCGFAEDWLPKVLAAHARHPDAAGVAGPVKNSTGSCAIDWANFYMSYAPFAGGPAAPRSRRVPPAANISFKRAAIPSSLADGQLEFHLIPALWHAGRIVYDESLTIEHGQSHGFINAFLKHFHNGRTTTGLWSLQADRPARRARLLDALKAPPRIIHETLAGVRHANEPAARVRSAMPLVAGLATCHALGELAGLALGPGRSPHELK
jgi:hypothetical protein